MVERSVVIELVILLAQASGPFLVLTRLEKVNSPKPKLIFSLLNEICIYIYHEFRNLLKHTHPLHHYNFRDWLITINQVGPKLEISIKFNFCNISLYLSQNGNLHLARKSHQSIPDETETALAVQPNAKDSAQPKRH